MQLWNGHTNCLVPTRTKNLLTHATALNYRVSDAPISLTTDASDVAAGAVFKQQIDGAWQPLAKIQRF